jgi:hypothetical protein
VQKLEMDCLKCILIREGHLNRLAGVVDRLQNDEIKGADSSELIGLLKQTRVISVETVKSISRFQAASLVKFSWNGANYLLKLSKDLNFLADVPALANTLQIPREKMLFNPFMLPKTLLEADNAREEPLPGHNSICWVEKVVLDEMDSAQMERGQMGLAQEEYDEGSREVCIQSLLKLYVHLHAITARASV